MASTVNLPSIKALFLRVALVIVVIVGVAGSIFMVYNDQVKQGEVESKVLTEARTLQKQMQAAWDYIDDSQLSINTDRDGTFDFKHVYCAVAGKGIARRFTANADGYIVRYVREDPRTGTDTPDEFEQRALDRFKNEGAQEYYEITEIDSQPVFRYSSALYIRNNCLQCHGEPAGEKDVTGFFKEGMEFGDLAGAVSIVIPMETYMREAEDSRSWSLMFFIALALLMSISLALVLRRWVAVPLEQANIQLSCENEEQSNFLAIMSHELRTPLSSIIAFTDIWEKNGHPKDSEEERLVRKIKESSSKLLAMVNNTIDVARLEAGQLTVQLDDVDLVDVVSAVFAVADPLAMQQNITLTKTIDPTIPVMRTDGEALRKVLLNLVSNALKFTAPGGSVAVEATMPSTKETVVITVRDTGAGIASSDQGIIFLKFSQSKSRKEASGNVAGSGLGLYLVKSLVERLGGTVGLESVVGQGSTFIVELPLKSEEKLEEHYE